MSNAPFANHLLGPAKSDQTLADMQAHPIWLWGLQVNEPEDADGVQGGDETGMRPWLGPPNVTHEMFLPHILLRVKGTNLLGVGQYDRDHKLLDALGVFGSDGLRPPWWSLQAPGIPITYIAVPSIEGRKNVEFVAKNRRRWQALMVGEFTPAEAEHQDELEISRKISRNKVSASGATLIRKDPELLKIVVPFLKRIARDNLSGSSGVVFADVAGWLEDEDPGLYDRMITEATTKQVPFRGLSHAVAEPRGFIASDTGETGILVVVIGWLKEGELYSVQGYWCRNSEHMQNVKHEVVNVDGAWEVKD